MQLYKSNKLKATGEYGGLVLKATDKFGIFKLKPGEFLLPGAHEEEETFYIVKGKLTVVASEYQEKLIAEKGDILSIPPGQTHTSTNRGEEEVVVFWCLSAATRSGQETSMGEVNSGKIRWSKMDKTKSGA